MNSVLNITSADLRIKLTEEIVFSFGEPEKIWELRKLPR